MEMLTMELEKSNGSDPSADDQPGPASLMGPTTLPTCTAAM